MQSNNLPASRQVRWLTGSIVQLGGAEVGDQAAGRGLEQRLAPHGKKTPLPVRSAVHSRRRVRVE